MSNAQQALDDRKSGLVGIDGSDGENDLDTIHMHIRQNSMFIRNIVGTEDPGIHEVSYFMQEEDGINQLIRREEFYVDSDITEGDRSIAHMMSDRVVSFDIQFLNENDELVAEWDANEGNTKGKLPKGMQVSLKLINLTDETMTSVFQINLQPNMGTGITWK